MNLSDIKRNLNRKDISQIITIEFGTEPFVICAPHHTPGGTERMLCDRPGDENTGYLALFLAERLRGQCIITNNYWLDPNKTCNDYIYFIKMKKPKFLVEIHGHGGSANFDIEISCGLGKLTDKSEKIAKSVGDEIKELQEKGISFWDDLSVSGVFTEIKYRGQHTLSLECAREWGAIPYHIEICPKLRKDDKNRVPEHGKELMEIIANFLQKEG